MLNDPIHDADVFGETAAGRLKSGGTADLLVGRALGKGLVLAVKTLAARDVMEDHHAVAGAIVLDAFSGCSDYAGGFMPKDAGRGMRTGRNFLEVGATDAAGVNAD